MAKGDTGAKPVVGVDLGGTKILAGVVDASGKILGTSKRATKAHGGPDEVIERMVKTISEAVTFAKVGLNDIAAVGVGAPGPLDPDKGIIWHTPNLPGWQNVPLAEQLSKKLDGVPVFIDNDVNLGALGEATLGAAKGARRRGGHLRRHGHWRRAGAGWRVAAGLPEERGRNRPHGDSGRWAVLRLRQAAAAPKQWPAALPSSGTSGRR